MAMQVVKRWHWWCTILLIAIVAILLLPFASELPDGLERVAEMFGFASAEREIYHAPFGDYSAPGLHGFAGSAVAAIIGIVIVAGLAYLLGKLLARRGGSTNASHQ